MGNSGAATADARQDTQQIADEGGSFVTGAVTEDERIERVAGQQAEAIAARWFAPPNIGGTLRAFLTADWQAEKEAARTAESYKDFRPLVLVIDDAMAKLAEGFGYLPKDKTQDKQRALFVFAAWKPAKVLEAVTTFAEGLRKKDAATREAFCEALKAYWLGWARQRDEASAGPNADVRFRGEPAPEAIEAAERRKKEKLEAWITIGIAVLKILTVVLPWLEDDAPPDEPEEPAAAETAEQAWAASYKPIMEAAIEVVGAALVLVTSADGAEKLNDWARKLKEPNDLLALESERLSADIDAKLNLPEAERDKNRKAREEERCKAREELERKSPGATVSGEVTKVLSGLAALVESALKTYEAWNAAFPDDLAGEWEIEGAPEATSTWLMTLQRGAEPESFVGNMSLRGFPPAPATRSGGGAAPVAVTEDKATVKLVHDTATGRVRLEWTPNKLAIADRQLPCAADERFTGETPVVEAIRFADTKLMHSAPSAPLQLCAPPGGVHALRFTRSTDLARVLKVVIGGFQLVGAIPAALPTAWEERLKLWMKGTFSTRLAAMRGKLERIPFLKWLLEHADCGWSEGKLKLGLKRGAYGVSASWDVDRILQYYSVRDGQVVPLEGSQTPWVPVGLSGRLRIPRLNGLAFSLAWEPWAGSAADPTAGSSGIEDKLDFCEFKQAFDDYLAGLGCKYDLLAPAFTAGDGLDRPPAVILPIALYLDEWPYEEDLPGGGKVQRTAQLYSKITVRIHIEADIFVNLFPQLRALLLAWEVGYAAGTFIRGKLMESPAFRHYGGMVDEWVADTVYDTRYQDRVNDLDQRAAEMRENGFITGVEAHMVRRKTSYYVWHDLMLRSGVPDDYDPGRMDEATSLYLDRLRMIRSRGTADHAQHRTLDTPRDPRFVDTEAEMLTFLFLWGEGELRRASEVKDKIDEALASGEISYPRAELLRLYLDYRELPPGGGWDARHEAIKSCRLRITSYRDSLERYLGADGDAALENPRWVDAEKHFNLVTAGLDAYLAALTMPMPKLRLEDDFNLYRSDGRYRWQVMTKMGADRLRVVFMETLGGLDDELTFEQQGRTHKAMRLRCRRHVASGWIDAWAHGLLERRTSEGTVELYAKVFDARTGRLLFNTNDTPKIYWTLTVDDRGHVTRAHRADVAQG